MTTPGAAHPIHAAGRWNTLSLMEQLGNVGSEVERALRAHEQGREDRFDGALARGLELFDLTANDPRWRGHRRREILRAREQFCRVFFDATAEAGLADYLRKYFLQFAVAARRSSLTLGVSWTPELWEPDRRAFSATAVRSPDASYVRADRLPAEGVGPGFVRLAPDLAVEVLSPNESASEVEEKLDDYRACGTPLIWVIDPVRRTVMIVASDAPVRWLREGDTLDGGTVILGIMCEVADLFKGIAR